MSQLELPIREGEEAPFFNVIRATDGTVHLASWSKTLCGKPRRRIEELASPVWWPRRCQACFEALDASRPRP